jgi:anionic cell wall polymer biosynthesis LytR-Cps2A-Psr (LCP) family protein
MLERRNRRANRGAIILGLIVLVVAATAVYAWLELRVDQITEALRRRQPIAALITISDGGKLAFAEAFFYNSATRKATLYHVPANLGGLIQSLGRVDGIDALYRPANPALLARQVGEVLGTPMQCWIDLSMTDIGRMADLLGGLSLFIPNPVDVTWQGRRILLPSGSVLLDGDKVRDYLAYQDELDPAEHVARQQKLVQSLLAGLGQGRVFLAQRSTARMLRSMLHTSLAPRALAALVAELGRFDAERMVLARALGNLRTVDDRALLFPHSDGEPAEAVRRALAANASSESVSPGERRVTVKVLNGTATPGQAAAGAVPAAADGAQAVAAAIHCTRIEDGTAHPVDPVADVVLILGRDFDGRIVRP